MTRVLYGRRSKPDPLDDRQVKEHGLQGCGREQKVVVGQDIPKATSVLVITGGGC